MSKSLYVSGVMYLFYHVENVGTDIADKRLDTALLSYVEKM